MAAALPSIAPWKRPGLEPHFIQGRRYTDAATRDIVEQVLAYDTNELIANRIEELGGRAAPLNFRTTNVLFGEQADACRRRTASRSTWAMSAM